MYGLQAAHDVTVTPIRAFTTLPDSSLEPASIPNNPTESGVKRRFREAYQRAKRKLQRNNSSFDVDSVQLEDSISLSV